MPATRAGGAGRAGGRCRLRRRGDAMSKTEELLAERLRLMQALPGMVLNQDWERAEMCARQILEVESELEELYPRSQRSSLRSH